MKFKVIYKVKGVLKEKVINSTMENCEKDANKVSKKWIDVILVDNTKGVCEY